MPYLRLYSSQVSVGDKWILAQKLISITLRALQLRPEQRDEITIQFLPRDLTPAPLDNLSPSNEAAAVLEVRCHDLTVQKISAFVEAAAPMLSQSVIVKHPSRVARLLGLEADASRQIAFQFSDMPSSATCLGQDFAQTPARKAA